MNFEEKQKRKSIQKTWNIGLNLELIFSAIRFHRIEFRIEQNDAKLSEESWLGENRNKAFPTYAWVSHDTSQILIPHFTACLKFQKICKIQWNISSLSFSEKWFFKIVNICAVGKINVRDLSCRQNEFCGGWHGSGKIIRNSIFPIFKNPFWKILFLTYTVTPGHCR